MANTNDFLAFGTAGAANVLDQATYAALAARAAGFSSGTAQSAQLNKVWRQASIVAAMIGQFVADNSGQNAVDDGNIATLEANFLGALTARLAALTGATFTGPVNVPLATASQQAMQYGQATGRLLRTTIYAVISGVQQMSIDGGAFTATGAGVFNSLPGTTAIEAEGHGGGGGSGGCPATSSTTHAYSGGGSGSPYVKSRFTSGFSGGLPVTAGAPGAAGAPNALGGNGGTTSLGGLLSIGGGTGSAVGSPNTGVSCTAIVPGGSVFSGANIFGFPGSPGGQTVSPGLSFAGGGFGGPSVLGSMTGYGSGAPGAYAPPSSASNIPGVAGKSGVLVIREYA